MSQVTVLDFFAEWCQPCKQISKVLPHLEKKLDGIGIIQKVDVDAEQALAEQYNIRSVPTFVLMQDGVEKDRMVGVVPMAQLEERVKRLTQQEN